MRIQFNLVGNRAITGVLPSRIATAYGKAIIYNTPQKKDEKTDAWVNETEVELNSVDEKLAYLLERFSRCLDILNDKVEDIDELLPIGIQINSETQNPSVLFLPPSCWKGGWQMKKIVGFYGDNLVDLCDENGDKFYLEGDKFQETAISAMQVRRIDALDWMRTQARQDPDQSESAEIFKRTDLKSKGHKLLCQRLERDGYMFSYEAHTIVPGDQKEFRRIDLIVFHRQACVIVEIDGTQHGEFKQRRDDYDRDRRITRHWQNTIRFTHKEVVSNIDKVMAEITDRLNPSAGKAHHI